MSECEYRTALARVRDGEIPAARVRQYAADAIRTADTGVPHGHAIHERTTQTKLLHEMGAEIARLRADLAAAREREGKLREALRGLLLSADASWEEGDRGHDWRESCERARALLAEEGKP